MLHLAHYLEASAARFPERLAAADPGGAALTYRELNQRASRIAGFLAGRGVQRGDRVGLALPKTTSALTAVFGILKAGAAYVPVDWTGPAERIATIFADCQVSAVFADERRPELGAGAATTIVLGEDSEVTGGGVGWETALEHAPLGAGVPRDPGDLAYILYTSGSTGVPKGVTLTHRNATSFVDWCSSVFNPVEDDRFSSHAPFHFDLSILDIYLPLKHGAARTPDSGRVGKETEGSGPISSPIVNSRFGIPLPPSSVFWESSGIWTGLTIPICARCFSPAKCFP